jgi:glutathione S-transferase
MNPNGRVPVIDDDGFVLWESNAIVRYLAAKHGNGTLCPADAQVRAAGDRWMDWATSTVAPVMTPLFWGHIRTAPEKRNLEALEAERLKMEDLVALLDAHLAKQPYLAGDAFSMGDIPVGCFIYRWSAMPILHGSHPHVTAWYERLQARAAFRDNVMLPLV